MDSQDELDIHYELESVQVDRDQLCLYPDADPEYDPAGGE